MADTLLDWISWLMLLTGGLVAVIGGLGLLRFPDFYTRLHAGGMTDTLCMLLIIGGLILQAGLSILTIKLALILLFMLFTAPTASHALARAAMVDGVKPQSDEGEPPSSS
ncbi:MAG: monovalent cation/H(+) antiporter subunit G [Xanthomonadales bacterium]|nr:monovalent cation/H(+) antiporter subunit G [Xanthomonadales bacterium]